MIDTLRPVPDRETVEGSNSWFAPSPELKEWARRAFIDDDAILANEDHQHLQAASLGFLWTNVENAKKGRVVIGTAEPGTPQGAMGKWGRAKALLQVEQWFGMVPDFLITIDAAWWLQASDAEACALIEHELSHCGQATDEFGAPKFNQSTGLPMFTMKAHDFEGFVGIARRYGAIEPGVRDLMDALQEKPILSVDMIGVACGSCQSKIA
jgi:hypothetical protein